MIRLQLMNKNKFASDKNPQCPENDETNIKHDSAGNHGFF